MALKLVIHTFRMIFGNLGQALRISVGPYLVGLVIASIALLLSGLSFNASFDPATQNVSPAFILLPILLIPLFLFITAWVAVGWHRFILLEEYAGILPAVSGRPIWPYAGKAILMGLLMMVIAIPIMLITAPLMASFAADAMAEISFEPGASRSIPLSAVFSTSVIGIVAGVPIYYVALRIGIALVGTAIGKPMGFGEAWTATAKIGGVIFGVVLILSILNALPGLLTLNLQFAAPIFFIALNLVVSWIFMMVGISILTTIYGHVIEERPLIG